MYDSRKNPCVAVENPTYKQAYRLFISQSFPVIPINMDRSGMKVEQLKRTAGRCGICDSFASVSYGNHHAGEAEDGASEMGE